MIDETSRKDIEKISYELLKQSKALDVFPTPVDKILNCADLAIGTGIDLSKVDKSFFEKMKEESSDKLKILQSGLSKIAGLFDRREKKIYVDLSLSAGKKNFVKLHEIGHGILPWQNEVSLACDNNKTLMDQFEDQFEAEANLFASITLFQQDRFISEISKLPLKISSAMALAKKFGSSVHSALRNYVLKSSNKCALLVLTPLTGAGFNQPVCETRNMFYSNSFLSEIGELSLPNEFGYTWDFIKDFKFNKKYNEKGRIDFTTEYGEILNSNYHYFYNGYNVFVLIFPKGEVNKSRTKIILQNI
jgi:hypothetical protein